MNEEILRKGIIDAYVHLRKTNSDIPSDVLDWIKDTCLDRVKNCSIPAVVGQSEQLVCDKCGYPMFYHKPDDIMYCHGCSNTKPAN